MQSSLSLGLKSAAKLTLPNVRKTFRSLLLYEMEVLLYEIMLLYLWVRPVTLRAKMSVVSSLRITDIWFWHSCCNIWPRSVSNCVKKSTKLKIKIIQKWEK